jgi:hypothetical protein
MSHQCPAPPATFICPALLLVTLRTAGDFHTFSNHGASLWIKSNANLCGVDLISSAFLSHSSILIRTSFWYWSVVPEFVSWHRWWLKTLDQELRVTKQAQSLFKG